MKDHGYITIFITLLLASIITLFTAVFVLTDVRNAENRATMALRSAMSSVRAEYDRYIFDQYHVLLLDADMDGEGTGKLEALAEERLKKDLGEDFTVGETALSGMTRIMDNDLAEFKEQVEAAVPYLAADAGVELLKEKVKGKDTPLDQSAFEEGDRAAQGGKIDGDDDLKKLKEETDNESGNEENEDEDPDGEKERKKVKEKDPRMKTRLWKKVGVAYMIAPDDLELSYEVLKKGTLPSFGRTGSLILDMDAGFNSYGKLKRQTTQNSGWLKGLEAGGAGLIYAGNCFNCLTDRVQEDTVLCLEMEYLIAGETSDIANYKEVVDDILAIRTVCNLAYLLTDAEKMEICTAIAEAACFLFPPATPVVKYLIAGAWSYMEAVADAYRLVRGKKVPYLKNKENWVTGINSFNGFGSDEEESESGLSYKDYLYILLSLNMDSAWYRMLDIIQINANSKAEEGSHLLDMRYAITAFGMTVDVEYGGHVFSLEEETGY